MPYNHIGQRSIKPLASITLEAPQYKITVFSVYAWGKVLAKCGFVF
jgi:hypothetical protein